MRLPFKSVAIALLFSMFFGPVGLLYASTLGGTLLILLAFVGVCIKQFVTVTMIWLLACIWSVAATNRYNRKILRALT
ncbi:MAG: hypothetical protein P4M14_05470 [Gammaproteobacteria bacterium]|nr:hypothetical protein [Gammaproteobacteria bacterium]